MNERIDWIARCLRHEMATTREDRDQAAEYLTEFAATSDKYREALEFAKDTMLTLIEWDHVIADDRPERIWLNEEGWTPAEMAKRLFDAWKRADEALAPTLGDGGNK